MKPRRSPSESSFIESRGKNLEKIRISKGYSQDRLTAEAGLSKGVVSKIETAKISPKTFTIAAICEALNVPIVKILPKIDLD